MEHEFLLAVVIVLVATIVSGLAGFGLSIISVPALLLLFDPGTVIALNKILTLGTTWIVVVDAWRHISWRWIVRVLPVALVGLFFGSYLLRVLPADVIKLIAGAVVVLLAMMLLTWQPQALKERSWMAPMVGLVSGTMSTSVGMSGPPLVLFFTMMAVPVPQFRGTAAMYFISLDLVGLPTLISQGSVTGADLKLSLMLAPVAVVGRVLGTKLVRFVSPLAFRRATLVLLLVTGTSAIVTGVAGLV